MKTETYNSLFELLEAFPTEQSCIEHLERVIWDGKPVSPFSEGSTVYRCKAGRYKCKDTGKYFNVRTGTVFGDTKLPLRKWFVALYLLSSHKKGISSHQLAKDISVTQKTAWFILHRLRNAFPKGGDPVKMSGIVQVDETYVGGKNRNLHWEKKKLYPGGRGMGNKTAVVGVMGMKGNVRLEVVENTAGATLLPIIEKNTTEASVIVTDNWKGYRNLNHTRHHVAISHENWEFARGVFNTNRLEGFWGFLKWAIAGSYKRVSPWHLQKYVEEVAYRYNTRTFTERGRMELVLARTTGRRLTYDQLISYGKKEGREAGNQTGAQKGI